MTEQMSRHTHARIWRDMRTTSTWRLVRAAARARLQARLSGDFDTADRLKRALTQGGFALFDLQAGERPVTWWESTETFPGFETYGDIPLWYGYVGRVTFLRAWGLAFRAAMGTRLTEGRYRVRPHPSGVEGLCH